MVVKRLEKWYLLLLSITSVDSFAQSRWRHANNHGFVRPSDNLIIRYYSTESDVDVATIEPRGHTVNNINNESEECAINENDQSYQTLVDEFEESIDLSREGASLESFNSYTIVAALTATSSLSVCLGLHGLENDTVVGCTFHYLAVAAASVSCLSGIYATVIFSLCNTYGNAAIGQRKDDIYDTFMKDSQSYRLKGFICYVISLSTFMLEIILISADQIDGYLRYPYVGIFSSLAFFIFRDWANLARLAKPIFSPDTDEVRSSQ